MSHPRNSSTLRRNSRDDIAHRIMDYVKLPNSPSYLELRVVGQRQEPSIRVTAPVEDGKVVYKVSYFQDYASYGDEEQVIRELTFPLQHRKGVVALIDHGYMERNRSMTLLPFRKRTDELGHWDLPRTDRKERHELIQMVLESLLGV
ncbi:expressed unknown protein [Seminavis robusta]|uniref:Uncharacterized protein n=1 Tax=Seminavis robusta TaxID=568900 RepID=A0A9N8HWA6_9STRA|nr:expressed unknown protein [Seminavis robusta]|eukprot:Sro2169_g317390.1 n/a (147) ;mRNA; r:14492-14932